jgi:hypothetical protein
MPEGIVLPVEFVVRQSTRIAPVTPASPVDR